MANHILFIFEGEKTEKQITTNLTQYFINENTVVQCAFCTDIYQLHSEISNDNDLDTFELLKEKEQNKAILASYNRNDFAEIYLFFDYDGHATLASDEKINELLLIFNEETSFGKLYISYPMVEALKHISEKIDFKELKVKAKEKINYKKIVSEEVNNSLIDFSQYSKKNWIELIALHLKKMNFIVYENYRLPKEIIQQEKIFLKQLEKYINVDSTVSILSSFPPFLFEYYGVEFIYNILALDK